MTDRVAATAASPPGPASGEAHSEKFDISAAMSHHVMAYPAVEYLHAKPVLILDLGTYAAKNLAPGGWLAHHPGLATADGSPYRAWAAEVAAKKGGDAGQLAQAMAVAADRSALGALPQPLAWMNQQIFFGTIGLCLLALVLLVVARRRVDQVRPAGRIQHAVEAGVVFVRDQIVRPNFHGRPDHGDGWVPYFAGVFLMILAVNMFGLAPVAAAASGNPGVTVAWALTTLVCMLVFGIAANGPAFFVRIVPVHWSWKPMDMGIWLLLFLIEVMGLLIKPGALAIRLFGNMFAGHTALLAFSTLGLIVYAANPEGAGMSLGLGAFGWVLTIALYFLELLIAFLQAYVFTILSATFIGACINPEH